MTSPLCFFGLGNLFEACFPQLLLAAGRRPNVLCDNDPAKWGQSFFGIPCIPPDHLPRQNLRVIICARDERAIYAQLQALGICDVAIARFGRGYDQLIALHPLPHATSARVGMRSLAGKWALVTGASRGIGRQIAQGLAGLGIHIVVHARESSHTLTTQKECEALGVMTRSVHADLSRPDDITALMEQIPPIDILYNNAGISTGDFLETYTVNTLAPIRLVQAVLPGMMSRGFGRIVNVSSNIRHQPGALAYACSKAALDKFLFDRTPSLSGTGVMMSQLDPGWLRTDMGGPAAPHPEESVLPGALLGTVMDADINGRWFVAQDYAGLSLEDAITRAINMGAVCP